MAYWTSDRACEPTGLPLCTTHHHPARLIPAAQPRPTSVSFLTLVISARGTVRSG